MKFSLVGNWENPLDSLPSPMELEAWATTAWRLKGNIMVVHINDVQLFLEFTIPEEAKWVMESRRRWFRGGSLKLQWSSLEARCMKSMRR